MTDSEDPREEKLPAWAKLQLKIARNRAHQAEKKLAAHLDTVKPTNIWYGDYDNPIYIPAHYGYQRVHFVLGPHDHNEIQVGISKGAPELLINGSRSLVIRPQVTNEFGIRFHED